MSMNILRNTLSYGKHFTDAGFWRKVQTIAADAGQKLIYAALLCYYVLKSPGVTMADKAKIYGALGYFILPIDLIPDVIPVIGYADDLSAILYCLHAVWKNVTPEMKDKARQQMQRWFNGISVDEIRLFE